MHLGDVFIDQLWVSVLQVDPSWVTVRAKQWLILTVFSHGPALRLQQQQSESEAEVLKFLKNDGSKVMRLRASQNRN